MFVVVELGREEWGGSDIEPFQGGRLGRRMRGRWKKKEYRARRLSFVRT